MFQEYRCKKDGKLLFKGALIEGQVEIKCKFCHEINSFEPTPLNEIICRKVDCQNRVE